MKPTFGPREFCCPETIEKLPTRPLEMPEAGKCLNSNLRIWLFPVLILLPFLLLTIYGNTVLVCFTIRCKFQEQVSKTNQSRFKVLVRRLCPTYFPTEPFFCIWFDRSFVDTQSKADMNIAVKRYGLIIRENNIYSRSYDIWAGSPGHWEIIGHLDHHLHMAHEHGAHCE